jgi:hypothetical protein
MGAQVLDGDLRSRRCAAGADPARTARPTPAHSPENTSHGAKATPCHHSTLLGP